MNTGNIVMNMTIAWQRFGKHRLKAGVGTISC
jgi:hypothetical protein